MLCLTTEAVSAEFLILAVRIDYYLRSMETCMGRFSRARNRKIGVKFFQTAFTAEPTLDLQTLISSNIFARVEFFFFLASHWHFLLKYLFQVLIAPTKLCNHERE